MNRRLAGTLGAVGCSLLGLAGCGDHEAQPPPVGSARPPGGSGHVFDVQLVINTSADLPACSPKNPGQTAFVTSTSTLEQCKGSAWVAIPCTSGQAGSVAYDSVQQSLWACTPAPDGGALQWTQITLPQGPQGDAGPPGPQGDAGPPGTTSLVATASLPSGARECPAGGEQVQVGLDTNSNGVLDATEVQQTVNVCNGPSPGDTVVTQLGLPTTAGRCTADTDCDSNYFCNAGTCDVAALHIAVGETTACALLYNGTVQCWKPMTTTPASIPHVSDAVAVASGGATMGSCAVLSDGRVTCWGTTLTPAVPMTDATEIAMGELHACALKSNGTVWCWGNDEMGQLGSAPPNVGTKLPTFVKTPQMAVGLVGVTAIASGAGRNGRTATSLGGGNRTCALIANGDVECWGEYAPAVSSSGVVTKTTLDTRTRSKPAAVSGLTNAESITVGGDVSCARVGPKIECWGHLNAPVNARPDGGIGLSPAFDTEISDVVVVAAGGVGSATVGTVIDYENHVCGILTDGSVACFGDNSAGQLGHGAGPDSATAITVPSIAGATDIATGPTAACVLLANGSVSCWGNGKPAAPVAGWGPGQSCTTGAECASGACLAGSCCTTPCDLSDTTCGATACDLEGACVYPNATSCGADPACSDASLTQSLCDGQGACVTTAAACPGQLACDPNDATSCLSSCAADTDCAAGSTCDTNAGTCGP